MESTAPPQKIPAPPRRDFLPPANTNFSSTLPTSPQTIDTSSREQNPCPTQTISGIPPPSRSERAPRPPALPRPRRHVLRSRHKHHAESSGTGHSPPPPAKPDRSHPYTKIAEPTGNTQMGSATSHTSSRSPAPVKTRPARHQTRRQSAAPAQSRPAKAQRRHR